MSALLWLAINCSEDGKQIIGIFSIVSHPNVTLVSVVFVVGFFFSYCNCPIILDVYDIEADFISMLLAAGLSKPA